jgi:hypothetical protein
MAGDLLHQIVKTERTVVERGVCAVAVIIAMEPGLEVVSPVRGDKDRRLLIFSAVSGVLQNPR